MPRVCCASSPLTLTFIVYIYICLSYVCELVYRVSIDWHIPNAQETLTCVCRHIYTLTKWDKINELTTYTPTKMNNSIFVD